jgi:hypothetical protein
MQRSMAKRPVLTDRPCVEPETNMAEQETHIATEDVRAGSTPHIVRYVLGISLALAILAMIIILGAR